MSKHDFNNQKEAEVIREERKTYSFNEKPGVIIFQYLSYIFMLIGFVSLVLVFFTEVTLLNAACFFVIGYTLTPTDADINKLVLKGVIEDIASIRLNTVVISKNTNEMLNK